VSKSRLDLLLVSRGLVATRERARALILAGEVSVNGTPVTKAGTAVDHEAAVRLKQADHPWVGRGGIKLDHALTTFDIDVTGRRALDIGASTGGFTDVLLRAGAREVAAVDVGYGQLAWRIRQDERVVVHDRTNIREVDLERLGGPVDLVVGDLSFISLTLVLDALIGVTAADGDLALMVKPQFEVGRERVGKGGVVRDPALRVDAVRTVVAAAAERGWGVRDVVTSPLPGPSGNVEFFVWLRRGPAAIDDARLEAVVSAGTTSVPDEKVEL
jgi:23S rRNA (cytidine1920-2'-O)/16S rRNA (cytidine1409-2'-O)-methyltransferase